VLYDTRLWRDAESAVVKRVAPGDLEQAGGAAPAKEETPEIIEDAADGGGPGMTEPGRLPDVMTDASITASIKTKLLEDADVPALSINVDTNDGIVTLFGQAHNGEARKTAEAYARNVAGVVDVRNEIRVVDGDDARTQVADDRLAKEVQRILETRKHLARYDITVSANAGVIRLQGDVPNRELKHSAATIARAVPGVRSVHNELRVAKE
jgi:osmotically-inducible protein OsmY